MKIRSISIEGMHKVAKATYNVSDLSYLYGKNGAGKSTVLQAIQLALLGYIPGTAKQKDAIMQHANGRVLEVKLTLDNNGSDVIVDRTFINTGKSITTSLTIRPETISTETILSNLELPIFNFDEFKSMTANKLKDWFIQFLPASDASVDWETLLADAVKDNEAADKPAIIDEAMNIINNLSASNSGVDLVRAVNAAFKEEVSYQKTLVQRSQSTIQSLVYYDDLDDEIDPDVIKKQISDTRAAIAAIHEHDKIAAVNFNANNEINKLKEICNTDNIEDNSKYSELHDQLKSLLDERIPDAQISELNTTSSNVALNLQTKTNEARFIEKQISKVGVCPYTNAECQSALEHKDQLSDELSTVNEAIRSLTDEQNKLSKDLNEMITFNRDLDIKIDEIKNQMRFIEQSYSKMLQLTRSLVAEPECNTEVSVDILEENISKYTDQLAKAAANATYNELMDKETKAKFEAELKLELYKQWVKLTDANGLQTTLMNEPFMNLADAISKYLKVTLGDKTQAAFCLSEKANSFSFGVHRDDSYIPFDLLSSGEKCLYTLALMMCIVSQSDASLKLILIDDLLDHLDPANCDKLFNALCKVKDIQFVLAGVQPCNISKADEIVIKI